MKKSLQIPLLALLGIAILFQVYRYFSPKKIDRPTIPEVSLTLLDSSTSDPASMLI